MVIQSPLGGACHQHPSLICFRFVPVYIVFCFSTTLIFCPWERGSCPISPSSSHAVPTHLEKCQKDPPQVQRHLCQGTNKCRSPQPEYQVGNKVWLSTRDFPLQVESRKLAPQFIRPFPKTNVINPVAVHLQLPHSLKVEYGLDGWMYKI